MQRRPALTALLVAVVVVLVAGVAAGVVLALRPAGSAMPAGSTAAALPAPKPITWTACSDADLQKIHARCGTLVAPLDWSHPRSGQTVRIALSEIVHTSSHYQGVMLMNPGGPGGSGLSIVQLSANVPNGVGGDYDWIGFDPRGVGASTPALHCQADYFTGPRPDYTPTTSTKAAWVARVKAYAAACAKNGAILDHMTTVDVAKDMDYLRVALGKPTINYYGFSYGTYLGEVYATLFPDHLRRMVLDSTVDPRRAFYGSNLDQDVAFEQNERAFFAWVAKYDADYHLGTTEQAVAAAFAAKQAALSVHPEGTIGSDEWNDIFVEAGYDQGYWPALGSVFAAQVRQPDAKTLEAVYDAIATSDNGNAVYLGVECTDAPWPRSLAKNLADNARVAKSSPFETWANAWLNMPCVYWPAKGRSSALHVDGSKAASVLMIDETGDAATPYTGSVYVRSIFPNARLLAEPGGTSHAETLDENDECVSDRIGDYLARGALPARAASGPDATCAPPPVPTPGG